MLRDDGRILKFESQQLYCELNGRYDSPSLRELLANLDREISAGGFHLFKDDKTTTVGYSSRDGIKLLIKRYNTKNAWHAVRRVFLRSRAQNCFEMARLLRSIGVNTPAPIAYVEQRLGPLKGRSWFVSEFVEGPLCLDYIKQQACDRELNHIAGHFESLFRVLSQHRISHGDMKATNFVLRNNRYPWLIDLDAMRQHSDDKTFSLACSRDRARFMKNWHDDQNINAYFEKLSW